MREVEHVVAAHCSLGEGPIWHPVEQILYWLDIYQNHLHSYDPYSGKHSTKRLALMASAMGVRAAGGFVMATKNGFAFFDPITDQFHHIADLDASEREDVRFNDGKTDRQGRFWAGKMSAHEENSLFRLDPDTTIHRMERGIFISNGLGWSPDNSVFYFTDSTIKKIFAYNFDLASGAISHRRVFTSVSNAPSEGFPDGLAVDAHGGIWSARWGGWKVVHYDSDGRVIEEIAMPVEFPTSCAFGGAHLNDLYITSACVEVLPENRDRQPLAGDVFRIKVDVPGLPEPVFSG